jgi:TPR repeat protein
MMKKYFLMSISEGNLDATYNLGCYYRDIEIDYELTKKYFLIAADKDYANAFYSLAFYYTNIEKNYDLASFYFDLFYKKINKN